MKLEEAKALSLNDVCETISRKNSYGLVGNTFQFKVLHTFIRGYDRYGKPNIYVIVESLNNEVFTSVSEWWKKDMLNTLGITLQPNQNVYSYKGIKLIEKKSRKVKVRRCKGVH